MKAKVDKTTCIGCELCVDLCPEVFEMEDDGMAVAKDVEIDGELAGKANDAKEQCPVDAIEIT
ncbi:MAG: ferredoxin [Clostridia bacterium]